MKVLNIDETVHLTGLLFRRASPAGDSHLKAHLCSDPFQQVFLRQSPRATHDELRPMDLLLRWFRTVMQQLAMAWYLRRDCFHDGKVFCLTDLKD